ncbi:hypothetical protein [Pontibacter rugosus]|uniref:ASCH domain-containing protein n=1 Tax=Pontibacter rugosus TaxID=1745966 RepID=A0ABW3SLU4_9BACT
MVLGFKSQFQDKILAGTKIHTVRQDPNNRWRRGNKINFATGVRTKNYKEFKVGTCISTQEVFMTYSHVLEMSVGSNYLFGYPERLEFAQRDGFDTLEDFEAWFYPLIKAAPDGLYKAKLIHWTDYRY